MLIIYCRYFCRKWKSIPRKIWHYLWGCGATLSGGQKQRIAIARALIKNSKIIIFDEATSALDSENETLVQKSIDNIVKNKKITTIIIAHRLSTIKNADCIYVLNKGEICEFGTHQELIEKNGIYKKLIENQI